MGILYIDGFDSYATADMTNRWTSVAGLPTVQGTSGRYGTGCLQCTGGGSQVVRTLTSNLSRVIVGVAFRWTAVNLSSDQEILSLWDGGYKQCALYLVGTTKCIYVWTNGGTIGTITGNPLTQNQWYYIEWDITISNSISSGGCVIYLNGVQVYSASAGANTRNSSGSSNNYANAIQLGQTSLQSYMTYQYDDLYILDPSSGSHSSPLGDLRVECIHPASDYHTDFTKSGGAGNYTTVADTTSDGDATYNQSATMYAYDLFGLAALTSTPGTIFAVQSAITARKLDAGLRKVNAIVRDPNNSTIYEQGSQAIGVGDNYATQTALWEVRPSDSTAWTANDIANMKIGYKIDP